ncbi:helix-turn-helix domain-containing protein [Natronorubrum daqingense]|uniref:Transcriptional regulator n=1 Tax=Natronorubrum daqingense TaxID=588898 RepID=A0A1N7DQM2_9EURY|nr:helix-turn-helix domain-containing protein [Natronorubrum daqingense]APX96113.1 transcriptional regulator [Natronorubrum daqingense]SIR78114.1 Sugar-specific transcriptional regulator TrmB [Natronorubrum daqingense]
MGSDNTDGRPREENQPDRPRDGDDDAVRTVALEEVDQRIVDLLSWILDTETRAKIYVFLLANPASTAEEVATGTGLYPSTVREALAELHDEERVTREKRVNDGAGNNPYAYTAIQPSDLVGGVVDQVQRELNTIFTLDSILERPSDGGSDLEPVTITVDDTDPTESTESTDHIDSTETRDEPDTSTETDGVGSSTPNRPESDTDDATDSSVAGDTDQRTDDE